MIVGGRNLQPANLNFEKVLPGCCSEVQAGAKSSSIVQGEVQPV
jgi:hypothetical protein